MNSKNPVLLKFIPPRNKLIPSRNTVKTTRRHFVDIFRSFGLKPYLSPSVNDGCPQLSDLLRMWCYKTDCDKDDIKTVTPLFCLLAKSCGKALDIVHAPKVLYRRDFWVSPLLPAMWEILYNVKKHIDEKFFATKCIDVFKAGKIMAGINLNTLDTVSYTHLTLPTTSRV